MSSGTRQRRSMTSASMPSSASCSAADNADRHRGGERDERDVACPRGRRPPRPSGTTWSGGAGSPLLANRPLCSKNTTGSSLRIADAISPTTSAGVDGAAIFSPGTVERPVLDGLRVLGAEAEAAAVGGADHERHRHLAAGHVAHLRDLVGEVVPAAGEEVGEHDLRDRPHPGHRRAHGGADDGLLGDRGVPHPLRAELLEQPDGRLEHALGRADVLAEADHRRVAAHLARDALGDRLAVGDHVPPRGTSVRPHVGERLGRVGVGCRLRLLDRRPRRCRAARSSASAIVSVGDAERLEPGPARGRAGRA